jgi:hypothetical protein
VPSSIRCCALPGSTARGGGSLGTCVVVFQGRLLPVARGAGKTRRVLRCIDEAA